MRNGIKLSLLSYSNGIWNDLNLIGSGFSHTLVTAFLRENKIIKKLYIAKLKNKKCYIEIKELIKKYNKNYNKIIID